MWPFYKFPPCMPTWIMDARLVHKYPWHTTPRDEYSPASSNQLTAFFTYTILYIDMGEAGMGWVSPHLFVLNLIFKNHRGTMKFYRALVLNRHRRCCNVRARICFRRLTLLALCFGLALFSSDRDRPSLIFYKFSQLIWFIEFAGSVANKIHLEYFCKYCLLPWSPYWKSLSCIRKLFLLKITACSVFDFKYY